MGGVREVGGVGAMRPSTRERRQGPSAGAEDRRSVWLCLCGRHASGCLLCVKVRLRCREARAITLSLFTISPPLLSPRHLFLFLAITQLHGIGAHPDQNHGHPPPPAAAEPRALLPPTH